MSLNTLLESANPYQSLQSDAAKLAGKWEKTGLLEGLEGAHKNNMGIILENQAKQLVVESSQTGGGAASSGTFSQTNIQEIKPRTEYTLMHELGHAHGEMGDEYITTDDRDVSQWADRNVNTTTQSPIPSIVACLSTLSTALHISPASSINFNVCVFVSPPLYKPLSLAHNLILSNLLTL